MKSVYKRLLSLVLVLVMVMSMAPAAQAAVSTTKNVMFFDLASPNYTTTLSSQIAVTYKPNGTGSKVTAYIKNLGWHYARYGGTAYVDNPLYCIEPIRNYGASTSYNTMDTGVTLTGSGSTNGTNTWYALPQSYREAIMLILLYSDQLWDHSVSVYDVARDDNMNVPLRIATQFLIYEIVCGLRNPDTFDYQWGGYTDADIFYWAGEEISWFAVYYNSIVSSIQAAKVIPSFTSSSSGSAPTIALTGDQTSVTDSNGVLANFSFSAGNGASFSKSGNTLYITQTGDISESTVFTATRSVPSAGNSAVAVYSPADTSYQNCVNLYSASNGNINAYFKLKAPAKGNINVIKTTSDNLNLAGWKFSVYADAACTSLVTGPSTTGSNGQLTFSGLSAGTFYVKEVGHSNASTAALYSCESTNPQKVTVTSGGTATVRFTNRLNTGTATLIKNTNTGSDRSGWQIGVYTDSGCTSAVSGSPFTTGQDGTVSVTLQPGTYYAKELSTGDSYWECDYTVKTFTVKANETATITFTNTQYGRIQFQKSTNTGNHLEGWVFRLRDADGNHVGDYTTDSNGYAITGNLPLGRYTVVELPTEDDYWQTELGYHDVTVHGGKTTVDAWVNNEQGLVWFYKVTNTEGTAEGWEISIYADENCTEELYTATISELEKAGYYLSPGIYYAKESGDSLGRFDSEYWDVDDFVHRFEIKPHEDVELTFYNTEYGKLRILKTMQPSGSTEGWQFRVTDADGKEVEGSPFTMNASGEIVTGKLLPGTYTVEELIPEGSLYYCESENPQTVTIAPSQTAEVSFANCLKSGSISIHKVNSRNVLLSGATFLLEWSEDNTNWEAVHYAEDGHEKGGSTTAALKDGCLTSGTDGNLSWDGLYPGLYYRITEISAPEGYELLKDYAFEGQLPNEDLTVELRVVNGRGFVLPETGSNAAQLLHYAQIMSMCVCGVLLLLSHRKKEW